MIGCGERAQKHAVGLKADDRCRVVGLSDIRQEAAAALDAEFGFGATLYTDHKEMLARERPEIVVACLWPPLHLPVFHDCVDAGVRAVLSEKPMAPTWGECREMARLAEESGCQLTFTHQRRFAPGNRQARTLIDAGRFGKIERMDLYSPQHLLDCGTHTFDQALSFNQESPAKWVLGAIDVSKPVRWFDVSAETMAVGTLVFENSVRANIQVGGPDKDMGAGVRVIGSDGFIEVSWDGHFGRAVVYADPAWKPEPTPAAPAPEVGVVNNAVDCLESGAEPELSYKKALRASEIIFAFYESIRRHARVELPLPKDLTDSPFLTMLAAGAFRHSPAGPTA
jgi:predicted dehydrogenase